MANVLLARCALPSGPAWGVLVDDRIEIVATDAGTNGGFLASLLQLPRPVRSLLERRRGAQSLKAAEVMAAPSSGVAPHLLPPLDLQEVWAAGVTYERSRVARMEETAGAETFYDKVYSAERPELFFKGAASRVSGHNGPIRIRRDASWNVPEPEIAVLVSAHGEIAGYTVGNDVSSRDIEGENPLYLPQAKIYTGSCAVGPCLATPDEVAELASLLITLRVVRDGAEVFRDTVRVADLRRSPGDLVRWLFRALDFPVGVVLLTGTAIVPPPDFTLRVGDEVIVATTGLGVLRNVVEAVGPLAEGG